MEDFVDKLQKSIDYIFANRELCVQALTHRSYGSAHNERLEFLGDAILDFLVAEHIYVAHPLATEGELSNMRARVVRGELLATVGQSLQLGELLLLGAGEARAGGRNRVSLIADAVEAIVAAVYLDGGLVSCRSVVNKLFLPFIESLTPGAGKDAKTTLQEYLQAQGLSLPVYEMVARSGDDHCSIFQIACSIVALGTREEGMASSRKKAEQLAAKKVLEKLGIGYAG